MTLEQYLDAICIPLGIPKNQRLYFLAGVGFEKLRQELLRK